MPFQARQILPHLKTLGQAHYHLQLVEEISGSHSGKYESDSLPEYGAVLSCRSKLMVRLYHIPEGCHLYQGLMFAGPADHYLSLLPFHSLH
jgi:hypothetical protein